MDKIYLSRRNLLALLSKLDRNQVAEVSACTIIKYRGDGPFRQSMDSCMVTAVEDDEYYSNEGRPAGAMHPADEEKLPKPAMGVI